MNRLTHTFALAAALLLAPLAGAAAQTPLTPEPIDSTTPAAVRARAIAELILAGDRAQIEAYLREHAQPSYLAGENFATELTGLLEAVKSGPRTIVRLDGLGQMGVGVALATESGKSPERAIVVGLEPAAPHRITALRLARIQGPGQ